jgi:energy-coupling factor transporter ATP-binding protein EcfA2
MTPGTATAASAPAARSLDPRLAAFLDPQGPEVFHAIVHQAQLWRADPFDVPTLHAEAREAFERALNRATADPPPEHGKVLLLLGEAGSGKTHLIRAFRHLAHASGRGCLGYLQMTAQADNYAAYVLGNLIDSLEQPYDEPRVAATGLARLSQGLLEALPLVDANERLQFREGHVELTELPKRVNAYADMAVMDSRFTGCDLDLIRALLYLQRDDPRIKARALQWLRCEDLAPVDREVLGGLVPRCREADPLRMIVQLGKLLRALAGAALVVCVDQLEDMYNQDDAPERLRKVVDALVAISDHLPSTVVVIACLEDYYATSKQHLTNTKLDRLEHDPPPIRLTGRRTAEEIEALVARRLEHLYDHAGVPFDPATSTFPFGPTQLTRLAGLNARAALLFCQVHQQKCFQARQWVEPERAREGPVTPESKGPRSDEALDQAWNDFHAASKSSVPDDEPQLANLLAGVIPACSAELPDGRFFAAEADGRVVQVELHGPGDAVERFLVAVCNGAMRGNVLLRQVNEVEGRAGEIPVAFVRSTDFPASPTAVTVKRLLELIEPKGKGRRAVVQDADWRLLLAFQEFARTRMNEPGFAEWQRASQPLSKLASLRKILALDRLPAVQAVRAKPADSAPPRAPAPSPTAPRRATPVPEASGQLHLGTSRGLTAAAVTLEPVALTRHAAFLGGSGSGKTTAALNLVEQLLLRGVPAVLVDRKGDLCRYADPAAWTGTESDSGLTDRRRRLRERLDVALYTPGQPAGRPLALPVVPPGMETLQTAEREQLAGYAAGALGAMMAYKPKGPDQTKLAILGKAIEVLAVAGESVNVPRLRRLVDDRDPALLTAVDGFEDRVYRKLGEDLLTLWLRHRALFDEGTEVLDVDILLGRSAGADPGRTRLSVISTRFLADAAAADFWVAQLLVAFGRWIARAPADTLQAVLLLDEADQYLPAVRQPATKGPLENLLRRARSAGLGLMLATQSPADFDYRCRDNIGTWLVGKVKEQRAVEKMRPMLAECRADVSGKLAAQGTGEFFLLRGGEAVSFKSERSSITTTQLSEDRISDLARTGRPDGPRTLQS